MRGFLWMLFVFVPLTVLAGLFAVSNMEWYALNLWPLPASLSLPMFLIVLAPLGIGLVVGVFLGWMSGGRSRRLARERGRKLEALLGELKSYRARAEADHENEKRRSEAARIEQMRSAREQVAAADAGESPKALVDHRDRAA